MSFGHYVNMVNFRQQVSSAVATLEHVFSDVVVAGGRYKRHVFEVKW